MLATKSAMTLALAGFLAWGLVLEIPQPSPADFHLELSFHRCDLQNGCSIEIILRQRPQEKRPSSLHDDAIQSLAHSLESLRDAAREFYRRQRHLA
jgi:hypothetical protein